MQQTILHMISTDVADLYAAVTLVVAHYNVLPECFFCSVWPTQPAFCRNWTDDTRACRLLVCKGRQTAHATVLCVRVYEHCDYCLETSSSYTFNFGTGRAIDQCVLVFLASYILIVALLKSVLCIRIH